MRISDWSSDVCPSDLAFVLALVLVLVLLALAWWRWHAAIEQWLEPAPVDDSAQRIALLESQLQQHNNELRQMGERIAANASAQRIIRDDLLGLGERAALLEDAVHRLADPENARTQHPQRRKRRGG